MNRSPKPRAKAGGLWRGLVTLMLLSACACNERPSDLRDWRPSDHDHTDNPGSDQVQVDPSDAGAAAPPGLEDVTIVAWQQNCTPCHGQLGRGDGPRGPMVKATNLSDPAWQSAATDEQIARTIKLGKGAMPPFNLPDATIAKLVKLVRMMDASRLAAERAKPAPGPSGSALPPGHPPVGAAGAASPPAAPSAAAKPAGPATPTPTAKPPASPAGTSTPPASTL
ncbi:MAG TPA: cytochrome c [Polyangiaceae bacterium]